jgi:uncharacterized RDD family membrane protein YckC
LPNLACACAKEKVFLPMTDSQNLEQAPLSAPVLTAAPLLTRILAMVLDSLALLVLLGSGVYLAFLSSKFIIFPRSSLSGVGAALLVALPAIALIVLLAVPIYFAIFESSAWSATPGKWSTGLIVRRSDGQRLGFFAALFARFIYWMPCLILPLGHFICPFMPWHSWLWREFWLVCFATKNVAPLPILLVDGLFARQMKHLWRQLQTSGKNCQCHWWRCLQCLHIYFLLR